MQEQNLQQEQKLQEELNLEGEANLAEEQDSQEQDSNEQDARTRVSAWLRLGVGAYLVYLGVGLFQDVMRGEVANFVIMQGAAIIFAVAGAGLIFWSCRYFFRTYKSKK